MGQYYNVVNLTKKEAYCPNMLKLMEHSWLANPFMNKILTLLSPGNAWYKTSIVWAGDYYSEEGEPNYYAMYLADDLDIPITIKDPSKIILVNHTTKEYVNYSNLPEDDGWIINPLSLLTALGNGRGGGDYYDGYPGYADVGLWATHILSVEKEIPKDFEEFEVTFIKK